MRRGEFSAERYATALLERAGALAHLNAFRTLDRDLVLEQARAADRNRASGVVLGALHGVPLPVKDSINTKLMPTSGGTRALENFRPRDDAAILKPLFAAGALLMGKTNLHELSFGWRCINVTVGAVKNPYDAPRIPGGSSGGSAAAVAARMAPLAVAEDTLGSIRVPATMCGLAGLRPTYGRYPVAGALPISTDKFDQPGAMARSVSDLVLFDQVVTGDSRPIAPSSMAGKRIGTAPEFFCAGLDPELAGLHAAALDKLVAAGATLVPLVLPDVAKRAAEIMFAINRVEVVPTLAAFLAEHGAKVTAEEVLANVGENLARVLEARAGLVAGQGAEAYREALQRRREIQDVVANWLRDNRIDALAYPPVLCAAPPLGDNAEIAVGGKILSIVEVIARNMAVAPAAGIPGLAVPAGVTATGLPVSIEFVTTAGGDRELLALGLAAEAVLGRIPAPSV